MKWVTIPAANSEPEIDCLMRRFIPQSPLTQLDPPGSVCFGQPTRVDPLERSFTCTSGSFPPSRGSRVNASSVFVIPFRGFTPIQDPAVLPGTPPLAYLTRTAGHARPVKATDPFDIWFIATCISRRDGVSYARKLKQRRKRTRPEL